MAEPDFSQGSGTSELREVFPLSLSHNASLRLLFKTDISVVDSGVESRSGRWATPLTEVDVGPAVRRLQDLHVLGSFFRAVYGARDSFLYRHRLFHTSAAVATATSKAPAAISPLDQELAPSGVDPISTVQLIKSYSTPGGTIAIETIRRPVPGSVRVAVGSVELAGSAFSVDTDTGTVTLDSATASRITAGYDYYLPMRFQTDELPTDLQDYTQGTAAVTLMEVRGG